MPKFRGIVGMINWEWYKFNTLVASIAKSVDRFAIHDPIAFLEIEPSLEHDN